MIIVKIIGGLGNQMFQYAFGKFIEKKYHQELLYDLNDFTFYKTNPFLLDKLIVNIPKVSSKDLSEYLSSYNSSLFGLFKSKKWKIFTENNFHGQDIPISKYSGFYFDGYWQKEIYLSDIREDLLKEFLIKEELNNSNKEMLAQIKRDNSISLHVRRGDFVTDKKTLLIHGVCSVEYYNKAVSYLEDKLKDPVFYVFSNDYNWAKDNIKFKSKVVYVDINDSKQGYLDMNLMKHCKNNIVANSSFSWWGAWLNENPNKIVISPKKWYASSRMQKRSKYLIPNSWVRL